MGNTMKYDAAGHLKTILRVKAAAKAAQATTKSGDDVEIRGLHDGDLTGRCITILDGGCVRGNIDAETVVILGTFSGAIVAERIHILRSAFVEGSLNYKALAVHPGAQMEAQCLPTSGELRKTA